jgi:hypothetical protein
VLVRQAIAQLKCLLGPIILCRGRPCSEEGSVIGKGLVRDVEILQSNAKEGEEFRGRPRDSIMTK